MDSYHGDQPWSFGAKNQLYELFNRGEVDEALAERDVYTRYKQHKNQRGFHQFMFLENVNYFNPMLFSLLIKILYLLMEGINIY